MVSLDLFKISLGESAPKTSYHKRIFHSSATSKSRDFPSNWRPPVTILYINISYKVTFYFHFTQKRQQAKLTSENNINYTILSFNNSNGTKLSINGLTNRGEVPVARGQIA